MSIGIASPNFLLLTMALFAPYARRSGTAGLGFVSGVIQGCLAGANLTAYAISRIVAGLAIGQLHESELARTAWVAAVTAFFTVLIAQFILLFIAPTVNLSSFALATIGTAIYNGVLAIPLDWMIGKLLRKSTPDL